MAELLDLILVAVGIGCYAALFIYKLVLMHRYRDDPEKLEAVISSNQLFPKSLHKFIYDEDTGNAGKSSVAESRLK